MKPLHQQILTILADGQFHSGEELGDRLNITRSAVWKIINQLQAFDIVIYSLKGKGYQIPNGLELLDGELINKELSVATKAELAHIDILSSITSTNDYLLAKAKDDAPSGYVCIAEHMTAGRGRRGRSWCAPFGANLYLSLLWQFTKDPAEIGGLSLAMAMTVAQTLQNAGIKQGLGLKWPNDILWQKQKLSGVLIDVLAESHSVTQVVIGVGINLSMPPNIALPIDQPWTDLQKILGRRPARNLLAAQLLNTFVPTLNQFANHGLKTFLPQWQSFDIAAGKEVTVHMPNRQIAGLAIGITEKGELLLKDPQNNMHCFLSGEVSLRL